MEKKIYIIRHGETDLNRQGIVQGRGINSSLNAMGLLQAEAFFNAYNHLNFDKIYTSSLQRTIQTVAPFLSKNIQHEAFKDLDEISWGHIEGKEITSDVQKELDTLIRNWSNGVLDSKIMNGESPLDVSSRLNNAIKHIITQPNEETILMCIHGRTLRILMCLLTETPLSQMDSFKHHNTALYIVNYKNGKFTLEQNCNTDHLLLLPRN